MALFKETKNIKIVSEDALLIRALQWAYDQGSEGFLMSQLTEAVSRDKKDEMWIRRMMMGEINGEPHLIAHMGPAHTGGEYRYFITSTGASTLIDYLDLKEARANAKGAMWWAIVSFTLAAVVGFMQIYYAAKAIPSV